MLATSRWPLGTSELERDVPLEQSGRERLPIPLKQFRRQDVAVDRGVDAAVPMRLFGAICVSSI